MSKTAKYWITGIITAAVLVIAVWVIAEAGSREGAPAGESSGSGMNHAGMDHGSSGTDKNLESYLKEQDAIMTDMMNEMGSIDRTENASIDFLAGMIPHHQSALAMAESYLKYGGENESLKQVAENVIKTQSAEIEQMNTMINDLKSAGRKDAEKEAAYLEAYSDMFTHHHMGHSMYGSVDEAFADGMMMHHQMAVDMARAILDYTDEEDVKTLAQDIIDAQEKEIVQMQKELDNIRNT